MTQSIREIYFGSTEVEQQTSSSLVHAARIQSDTMNITDMDYWLIGAAEVGMITLGTGNIRCSLAEEAGGFLEDWEVLCIAGDYMTVPFIVDLEVYAAFFTLPLDFRIYSGPV